jgi:hypothetical protein
MHEKRNFLLVIVLVVAVLWAAIAWLLLANAPLLWPQRLVSLAIVAAAAAWLVFAFRFEDKLPNHLKQKLGRMYYEADGLSFMPMIRSMGSQAELAVYYQNRYENPAQAIVHLRPPEDSFIIRPGMRDVHFAFRASGGDFGVIHQPIAVPRHLQGEVIEVLLAAVSFYPRSHGARLRGEAGIPCGTMLVDWGGAAFRSGVHEGSGEVELIRPVTLHLPMPTNVRESPSEHDTWKQQQLTPGKA